MIRGELLLFLLVFEIFSFDFFRGRQADVLDFFSLPPKITQWDTDSCTRTIHIQAVTGGMSPYDIHVYKQDPLDSSHWSLYRLVKEQLPRITGLPAGNYRLQVRNEGESYRLLPAYLLAIRFEPEPDLLLSQSPAACSGAPQAISFTPLGTNAPSVPILWTTEVLMAPDDGELLGASTSFSGTETQLLDTLINTGKSPARIRYEIRPQVSGCPGEPRIVERVVDPVAALKLVALDSLYCSGIPTTLSLLPETRASTAMLVSWTVTLLEGQASGFVGSGPMPVGPITQTLVNHGIGTAVVRYTLRPESNGCVGKLQVLDLRIAPEVQAIPLPDRSVCAGDWVSLPVFSAGNPEEALRYSWSVSDASIGLPSTAGEGAQLPTFQAVNTGTTPKSTQVSVQASYYDGSTGNFCAGLPRSFTLTVRSAIRLQGEMSSFSGHAISCAGAADGKIRLQASRGLLPTEELAYTYVWTGPAGFVATQPNLEGLLPGTYLVQVRTKEGSCAAEMSFVVTEPAPLTLTQSKVDNVCAQGATGSITVTAAGGTAPYTYAWTGPNNFASTVANPMNLVSGTYQVTVRDVNGCTIAGAAQTITEPAQLTLTQSKVDNICFQGSTGSITVTPSGGTAPYTYAWTGPNKFASTVANPQNLVSGTYQMTVTDANGCVLVGAQQTINAPTGLALTQNKVDNVCAQGETGSITITPTGGNGTYSFAWTGPNGFTSTNQNLSGLSSGTYQVTVRDVNGCTITGATQTITEPTPLTITNQVKVDNVCAQGAAGSITVTASGGTDAYTYAWTGPNNFAATVANPQNLVSGTYQVTVRDANGCSATGTAQTITEPAQLTLAQTSVNIICFQGSTGSITVTPSGGTAPYTYAWTGPNNFASTLANPQNLVSGTYQVTVTDVNNCFVTGATQTITEPTALTITNQVKVDNICFQGSTGSITVIPSGGTAPYTYAWIGPNNFISTLANPQNLVSGTYQVTVRDANGCTITGAAQTITEPAALTIANQVKVDNVCAQGGAGRITVTPSGGTAPYTYAWTGPNNFSSTLANPQNLVSGTYQVTVTDVNNCFVTGAAQTITEPAALTIANQVKVDNVCAQGAAGSITVTAAGGTGAYTYAWTGPNNFSSTLANPQNLVSGTYQVTVTDANGCTITGVAQTITEPTALTITNQVKVDNVCAQGATGSITVTAAGGTAPYTYAWTGPNNFTSTVANPQNLVSGTYQVTVTDANGCTITGVAQTITEPAALTIANQVKVDNVCAQGAAGSITVTAAGGTAPYTYAWTGPNNFTSTVANPQNLVSGTYQVTVRDANGCSATGTAQTITEPAPLAINAQVQGETCADAKDGRIELTPTGGTAPYQYSWDHGATGPVVTGLGAGTYRVTLTDQNGCTQTAEYVLLPVPVLRLEGTVTYQATQVPLLIFAVLQSDAQGGTPPYTYRWSSGQTTPSITVTESGAYTLKLQDATGCVLEKEFAVAVPLPLAIDVDVNTIPLCEEQGQESTLRLSIQEGLPPYQITWSRGTASQGGLVLITRESGLFDVEVRDALGLVQKRILTILPRLTGPLDFEPLFESQTQFKADLVGFKGVFRPIATWPHQVISWDFGDGTSSAEPNPSHTYTSKGRYTVTLTVLDESGCLITHSKGIDILDYFIEIPNVFTPNGDQLNDTFFPKFSFIPSLQLQVMNKWGELIYRSHGLEDAGWDGTAAGQKAPEGVYVYKLTYQVPDGRNFTSSSTFLLAR